MDINELVLKYRDSDDEREKNRLFKLIESMYLPKVYMLMQEFPKRYHDDIRQQYRINMLHCIFNWKNDGAKWSTYAYIYAGRRLKTQILRVIEKDNRMDSIEAMEESEEDIY